jgi:outer membrane protein assembly factor BamE (lipoprotein component of BamABCDE complex)
MIKIKLRTAIFFISIVLFISCSSDIKLNKERFEKAQLGMTPKEVKAVLGEPDEVRPSVDWDSNYFYYIKNTPINTDYAEVYFDKNGKVSFLHYGRIE